jgi:hypothetical protein
MIRVVSVDKRFGHLRHPLRNINFDVRALETSAHPDCAAGSAPFVA